MQTIKDIANKATEIAKTYSKQDPRLAIEHGIAFATKGMLKSTKNQVRAELRKRGFRI
jgi:hypothetical protein